MKKLMFLMIFSASLAWSGQVTATVTVPDALIPEIRALLDDWAQANKVPGATPQERLQAVFDSFLRTGLRRLVKQACDDIPSRCPAQIKQKVDARTQAIRDAEDFVNDSVR